MFGTIDIKVRPIKIAYLVNPNAPSQVREAIRLSSTLWGGTYFPIFPLYNRMPTSWKEEPFKTPKAKDVLLGYIEAFDPDILVQFADTIPSYISDLGLEIIKPDTIWKTLDHKHVMVPRFGLGLFELLNDIFDEHFKYTQKYPVKVRIPRIPRRLSLFWASLFGDILPALVPTLEKSFFPPLDAEYVDVEPTNLRNLLAADVLFPRRITARGLSRVGRGGHGRNATVYFLDAAKTEDIVDFWNLRALGQPVLPVPKQLHDDPQLREIVIDFLKDYRRPWPHDPKVCDFASLICARNCTMAEVQEFAKTVTIPRETGDPSDSPFFAIQHWYPRIWDEWARGKDDAVPATQYAEESSSIDVRDTTGLTVQLKPLLPLFADEHAYHGEPRCANDVSFRFYGSSEYLAEVFPKAQGQYVSRAIAGLTSFPGDWRVGRYGLVKLVKDTLLETREIPTAERIMLAWLADRGWTPTLSSPGLLAKQIYRRLNGHVAVLRNETLLGLLEHMNGGSVQNNGQPVAENRVTQPRDLNVGEVKNRLAPSLKHGGLYDYLISKGIFSLGCRLQCPNCLRESWLSLAALDDKILCPKCQDSFPAIGNLDSAVWSYKTAGAFSVPRYADGAYAVLTTLAFLEEHASYTLRTTPVFSITASADGRKALEADFALLWEEASFREHMDGVMFGECKTYGLFEDRDFDRMRYLAKSFPGAVIVFSTLRKTLTAKEIRGIKRLATPGRKYWKASRPLNPVLVLTGNELLNDRRPPDCWPEPSKSRFRHITGILNLCDATQQIYLKLTSWETEWQKKAEKKHHKPIGTTKP